MTPKSVKPLYFIINNTNGYVEESNGNKYLKLVPTDEIRDSLKNYEKYGDKSKDLVRSINNNSGDNDKKYMKNQIQFK